MVTCQITFDKTKHMSDKAVNRRKADIEKVRQVIRAREETVAILKKEELVRIQAIRSVLCYYIIHFK